MTPPDDITLLSSIRGRFRFSRHERFLHRFFAALCAVVFPSIMLYALFEHGVPQWPLSLDQLACAVVAPMSFALGLFLWFSVDGEYQFTGNEIVYRKAGFVRWRLPIASTHKSEWRFCLGQRAGCGIFRQAAYVGQSLWLTL